MLKYKANIILCMYKNVNYIKSTFFFFYKINNYLFFDHTSIKKKKKEILIKGNWGTIFTHLTLMYILPPPPPYNYLMLSEKKWRGWLIQNSNGNILKIRTRQLHPKRLTCHGGDPSSFDWILTNLDHSVITKWYTGLRIYNIILCQ